MGLEGLVSKHRERVCRPERCDHWIKVKNRKHPAYSRVQDQF
jgi:ATP-dependent DNA ligase